MLFSYNQNSIYLCVMKIWIKQPHYIWKIVSQCIFVDSFYIHKMYGLRGQGKFVKGF